MPDTRPRADTPATWSDAFAALPLETPPAGGWQRVAATLPAPRRARWPLWAATAAALAVVAIVPLKLLPTDPAPAPSTGPAPDAAAATATPAREAIATTPPTQDAATGAAAASGAGTTQESSGPDVRVARQDPPARNPDTAASQPAVDGAAARPVDAEDATALADSRGTGGANRPEAAAQGADLERLYAESAQLEALLALARDDRVASGTADTLASGYEAQLASIDAALTQPDLGNAVRTTLWQDRVDVLRQAATFESTRRMLAAQGERYDAMLVSID